MMTAAPTAISTIPRPAAMTGANRYLVLVGAILIQLILGTVYGYSIFWQPLQAQIFPPVVTAAEQVELIAGGTDTTGYTIVQDNAGKKRRLDEQQGYLKYAFSICILSFAVVMVIAGRVQDVKGPRFTATIGAALMGGGFLVAGLMNHPIVFYLAHASFVGGATIVLLMLYHALFGKLDKQQFPILEYVPLGIVVAAVTVGVVLGNQYVGRLGEVDRLFLLWGTVGFLAGAGIGFAYVCPIAALIKWFPDRKGLVAGVAVAGFGFGAYLFKGQTVGAAGYIRSQGIVSFFLVHGLVCLIGISVGAMLLRNPPSAPTAAPRAGVPAESSWQDTLKRPAFYLLWLMFFSGAMAGLMVIGILKPFVEEQVVAGGWTAGQAAATGLAAVGYLAIFNAIGRIAWGFISDRIGRSGAFVLMFAIQAAAMFLLGMLDSRVGLCVAAAAVGFNFGGNFALFPSATADLFGAANLGANYGWVFTSYGIAGVVGIAAGNVAKSITGSYSAAFMVAGVLCLISATLAIAMEIRRRQALQPTP